MRKSLLLGMGVFTLAACAPYPYPGPGPRFWGPREEVFFAYTLTTLLLSGSLGQGRVGAGGSPGGPGRGPSRTPA